MSLLFLKIDTKLCDCHCSMAEYCYCRMLVVERTAWTEKNAGRRFVSCVYSKRGCKYFRWVEGPICERGREVIRGLLRRIENREEEKEIVKTVHNNGGSNEANLPIRSSVCRAFVLFIALVLILYVLSGNRCVCGV